MISKEVEASILRYHFVEKWPVGTISSQLGIHHTTVSRVLSQAGIPSPERKSSSMLDPYLPFITETLEKFPNLTAARLFGMAKERGYPGKISNFRSRVAQLRPKPKPEAFMRLKTLPGEEAQVDWGHFGHIQIGRAKRPLMAFVMVLSWSRTLFLRFYLNQQMANFLRGHAEAFERFGGTSKIVLYDNLKSAVLARHGNTIQFHPTLLEVASHYRFEPRPVAVARGNEKGRVERAIRYIRDSFFAGRQWTDLSDLNTQADQWCAQTSADRRCPENTDLTVREAFHAEQPRLLALPADPFPTEEQVIVTSRKTPYIRFDLNDYSVPHTHVQSTLEVRATLDEVRILEGGSVIAHHTRSFDKGVQIEDQQHIEALQEYKFKGKKSRNQDRLSNAAPSSTEFLLQAVDRGAHLPTTIHQLIGLLDQYGAAELEQALKTSIAQQVPHEASVRQVLEQRREALQKPPPITIPISNDKAKVSVKLASLSDYDKIGVFEDAE